MSGLHHALTTLHLQKEPLVDYGQDGGYQTQREKSLLHQEWGVLRPPSPQPSPLLSAEPSSGEPILIYKIQESDKSMQIVDNKPACVETANSSVYNCDSLNDQECVQNTMSPLLHTTHRATPELCY